MKQLTMTKVLTPLAALAFAFGVQAAVSTAGFETTEGYTSNASVTNVTGWSCSADTDESVVTAYDNNAPSVFPDGTSAGSNYLKLSTEDSILFRNMDGATGQTVDLNAGLFVDTDVQFTITTDDRPQVTAEDKFIVWLEADSNGTNLCAWAGYYDDQGNLSSNVYTLVDTDSSPITIQPNYWYRLTVKAVSTINGTGTAVPGFQVYVNGHQFRTSGGFVAANAFISGLVATAQDLFDDGQGSKFLPAMTSTMESLTKVGFSGEGALDNVVVTKSVPAFEEPTTLTFNFNDTIISSIDIDDLGISLSASGSTVAVYPGQTFNLTLNFASGYSSTDYDVTTAVGEGQSSIASVNDLAVSALDFGSATITITTAANNTASVTFDFQSLISTLAAANKLTDLTSVAFTAGGNTTTITREQMVNDFITDYTVNNLLANDTVTVAVTIAAGWDISYAQAEVQDDAELTINGSTVTVDAIGNNKVATVNITAAAAAVPEASINGQPFNGTFAEALATATAGQTVTLNKDVASGAISTAAGTIDLNGNTLTLTNTTEITFTGTGAKTLKGGDLMGVYHELTITVPAGENLTFDGMTFHASVKPHGSGALLTATNCRFLCDYDKTGAAFTDGSSADVHSYGLLFDSATLFAQADVVNNYFDQGRRAAVQASIGGDLYFYGNTVVADKLTSRVDGANTRYPALQIISNGGVFIENNSFSGQYLGEAFCVYNKGTYRTTDKPIVFNGNVVSNGVNYLWGIYDVDASGSAPLVNPDLYFGANTVGDQVDLTGCIYKTTVDGVDMNGVTYSHTPATLALPTGVATVYEWTHGSNAGKAYVSGGTGPTGFVDDLSEVVAGQTVIGVPGAEVTSDTCILTADATLKNQYTTAAAAAKVGNTLYATFKEAVDAANAGDTVVVLADCAVPASVSFTKNVTVSNDYTIAANVNYALCIGATVTFEGSGMIQRGSTISGSAFCVGANETTRGAITVGTAGTLVFNGGTICGGNGGNQIKLENGTVTMNGGVLKDGLRGIKADADAGSYTSAIVINGGTITNCSAYAVFASAESANGTATITINGGEISGPVGKAGKGNETITIPGNSTAKFDRDQSAFCASGYETTLSDGWYVVTAVQQAGWVDDSSTVSNQTAATAYPALASTALADADAQKLTDWATDNSIAYNDVVAAPGDYVEAFLLNCAVANVATEKAAFKATITVAADGTVTVSAPEGKNYNGTLQLKGKANLTDAEWTDVAAPSSSYKFYKYTLSL